MLPVWGSVGSAGLDWRILTNPNRTTFLFSFTAWYIAARAIESLVGASNIVNPVGSVTLSPTAGMWVVFSLFELPELLSKRFSDLRLYAMVAFASLLTSDWGFNNMSGFEME